jgi:hypothetical protein
VRGRELWRLVGAEEISSAENSKNLAVFVRVLSLIRRLVRGEEKNERIFLTLFSLRNLLAKNDSSIDLPALETLAVFRILHALGYIKSNAATEPLITPLKINQDLVASAKPLVPSLISAINAGLTESHL